MPYHLSQNGLCVEGEDNKPVPGGCHKTHEEAVKHLQALYANVPEAKKESGGFLVFKQADGQYRWLAVSSTSFLDRDREFVTRKALAGAVEEMDAAGRYGELDWWHVPGADIGDCDFSMLHNRSLVESGTFREPWMAEALAREPQAVSLMFRSAERGTYDHIQILKRSVLPPEAASNLLTDFAVIRKETDMPTLKEKLEKLLGLVGPENKEAALQFIAEVQDHEKAADEAGLVSKEAPEPEAEPAPPAPEVEKAMEPESPAGEPAEGDRVGHMSRAELEQMVRDVVDKCMNERMGAMKKEVDDLTAATVAKQQAETQAAETLRQLQEQLDKTAAAVRELSGDMPRDVRVRGYRASEQSEITKEQAAALSDLGKLAGLQPKADPFLDGLLTAVGAKPAGDING